MVDLCAPLLANERPKRILDRLAPNETVYELALHDVGQVNFSGCEMLLTLALDAERSLLHVGFVTGADRIFVSKLRNYQHSKMIKLGS